MGKRFTKDSLDRILSIITDEEERRVLLESDDPVLWAENHFYDPDGGEVPFKAKEMFYEFLRTGNKDRAGRIGRQAGKCESKDTHIQLADGSWPTASELFNQFGEDGSFKIISTDQRTYKHNITTAVIKDNGYKKLVQIDTTSGFCTKNTSNHPYLIWKDMSPFPEWIDGSKVEPGDRIAVTRSLEIVNVRDKFSSIKDKDSAALLGYLVGDGGTSQHTIKFTSENTELIDKVNEILRTLNTEMVLEKLQYSKYDYSFKSAIDSPYKKGNASKTWITDFTRKHNLSGKLSKEKEVPIDIFTSSNEIISSFIGAYWDTDGWICNLKSGKKTQIGVGSSSYKLICGVRTLLLRLGIQSRIKYKPVKYNGSRNPNWQLTITDFRDISRFAKIVPIIHVKKKEALINIIEKNTRSTVDTIPSGVWLYVDNLCSKLKISLSKASPSTRIRKEYSSNRTKFSKQISYFNDSFLNAISESDIFWDEVKSVTSLPKEQTYAIYVPETNNLITDNFITHNTVHTTLDIMHTAAFSNNAIINVFLPEKKNMNRMLEIMANLLGRSDLKTAFRMGAGDMKGGAKGDVKPSYDYEIQVASGSCIRFFFMSHKPDKARGQRATHMYIDEADYLPEKAFDVINGIVKGNLGIRVTAISTPSGMEDSWFRNFCNACSKNGTEFHISTKQEKNWLEIEKRLRELIFDDVTWNLEVLAEWADAKGAVYKKDLIDNAINRSFIGNTRVTKEEIYETSEYKEGDKFLGVDWNVPQNGVRLVEITKMYDQYWVTRNHKIAYDEFTQTKSVEEILKLHDQFGYKYISVDLGYGEVQIELLLKALAERGDQQIKVLNIVDSQKKEEMIIDTETPAGGRKRTIINVRTKTKIVGLVSKFIESSMVFFQEDDAVKDGIVKEVRNFRRKGTAMDGGFLYSENTHSLSALQIAVHGLDKWVRYGNLANRIVTEVKATASLNDTLKRGRQNMNSIQSSPFYIKRSTTGRTGGLSRG